MAKAAICFANHDAAFAEELAHFLEVHTSVNSELAECSDPTEFLDTIEQCLICEIVIVVLSQSSVPRMWSRPEWERVLIDGVRQSVAQVGYLLREVCPFPPVLKRRAFFNSLTEVRRWVIQSLNPDRISPSSRADLPRGRTR